MRAKFQIRSVTPNRSVPPSETVSFFAVTEKPFDAEGVSEDNEFAKWTPSVECSITITNPALLGTFAVGEKFYVDFIKAEG